MAPARTRWSPNVDGPRFDSILLYTRVDCSLCEEAAALLTEYRDYLPPVSEVDIDADPELTHKFDTCVPVVEIESDFGALLAHITGGHLAAESDGPPSFQPMNVNFGLFPPLEAPTRDAEGNRIKGKERGAAKKRAMSARALADIDRWLGARELAATAQ